MPLPKSEVDFALSFLPQSEHATERALLEKIHAYPPSAGHVIFSVFGSAPKYTAGIMHNIRLQPIYYPGWAVRIYISTDVPDAVATAYRDSGANVIEMGRKSFGLHGTLWRFLAAIDPSVERYIIRDADSRLNGREREAVQEWIESGKSLHVMRDHPNHNYAVNAGMWGGVPGVVSEKLLKDSIGDLENKQESEYGDDQRFLRDVVYKKMTGDIIGHDSFSCQRWENSKPFPSKRSANYQHVGQVYDQKNQPRMGDINCCLRGRQNPMECRGSPDWLYG